MFALIDLTKLSLLSVGNSRHWDILSYDSPLGNPGGDSQPGAAVATTHRQFSSILDARQDPLAA